MVVPKAEARHRRVRTLLNKAQSKKVVPGKELAAMDREDLNYAAPEAQAKQGKSPFVGRFGAAQRAASAVGGALRAQSTNPLIRK